MHFYRLQSNFISTFLFRDESNFELRLVIPFLLFLVLSLLLDKSGPAVVFVVAVSTDISEAQSVVSVKQSVVLAFIALFIKIFSLFC